MSTWLANFIRTFPDQTLLQYDVEVIQAFERSRAALLKNCIQLFAVRWILRHLDPIGDGLLDGATLLGLFPIFVGFAGAGLFTTKWLLARLPTTSWVTRD